MNIPKKPLLRLALISAVLTVVVLLNRPREELAVRPAPDLLRLEIPRGVGVVTEHHPKGFEIADDVWILQGVPLDSRAARNGFNAYRGIAARNPAVRIRKMEGAGGSEIHRIAVDDEDGMVEKVEYQISFGGEWVWIYASPRAILEPFDPTRVDALVRGLRLGDAPKPEAERPPAWEAYQRDLKAGGPIAKMVLAMPPAPVRLGDPQASLRDDSLFKDEDHEGGGRIVAPDLIEFYPKDDPAGIRLDVILEDPPAEPAGERIFEAPLGLADGALAVSCADAREAVVARVPPGRYHARVWVVNRGVECEESLTDGERFARDDLERYEVRLTPLAPDDPPAIEG